MLCRFFSTVIILISIVACLAETTYTPIELQNQVEECAQACVDEQIHAEFSPFVCSLPSSLSCLCSQYQQAGPSLDNIIVACRLTDCLNQTIPSTLPVYDYCSPSPSATTSLVAQNPTATVTQQALDSNSAKMSTLPLSITDPGEVPSATEIATAPIVSTTLVTSVSSTASSTPSSSSLPAPPPTLTPAQIAGVTISGVATAVIVFFLMGSLLSCYRRRKRDRIRKSKVHKPSSRFGTSDKELATDVEPANSNKDGQSTFNSPSDVARAYPTIEDPAKIGVAVSSPSQIDNTPVSSQGATSWAKLLPAAPPQLRLSPPRETKTRAQDLHRQSYTPVSPPSASAEMFSPVIPVELHGESARRGVPSRLNIQRPPAVATFSGASQSKRPSQRESTQSVATIINEEPMSPPARMSITKIMPQPVLLGPPHAQPRSDAESRDYIPSYYMQPSTPLMASPAPQTPSAPKTYTTQPKTDNQRAGSKNGQLLSPPMSKFARPVTSPQSLPASEKAKAVSSEAPQTPPSQDQTSTGLRTASSPHQRPYGLPANPRTPPKGSPPPVARNPRVPSPSNLSSNTLVNQTVASPPSSWRAPSEPNHSHQSRTPPPAKAAHSAAKSGQKPLPPPTRRSSQKSRKRESMTSMTSFETSGDETEATPPEDESKYNKQLSPLPESSAERSPISALKYPRVPRPANQSVTRSTGSPSRAGRDEHSTHRLRKQASNSSLLEKRKGSDVATEFQKALWITGSNGSTSSSASNGQKHPIRGSSKGRPPISTGSSPTVPEMQMRSPLWEPKLTPKRDSKGALMIEVN